MLNDKSVTLCKFLFYIVNQKNFLNQKNNALFNKIELKWVEWKQEKDIKLIKIRKI